MARERSYSDEALVHAVDKCHSWRAVLRELGLASASAGAMRAARSRADEIGLSYKHFVGQRQWTDERLRMAVIASTNWSEVAAELCLEGDAVATSMKGHARRLGLDTSHFRETQTPRCERELKPDLANLDRTGPLLAAAWYMMTGHDVSWPLEPSRYDLLVTRGSRIRRVQVKTTTVRVGDTWKVYLSTSRRVRKTYDPDEIEDFFIVDGDFECYLIPIAEVGGLHAIHLSRYERFQLHGASMLWARQKCSTN